MASPDDKNTLYFLVGGLVVVAVVLGVIYWNNDNNPANIEPAAGGSVIEYNNDTTPDMNDR